MSESLFGVRPTQHGRLRFDMPVGETVADHERLTGLLKRVAEFVSDGKEHTLPEIAAAVNGMEASVSARLRDLRKRGWQVERRRDERAPGLWHYRASPPESKWRAS